MSDIEEDDDDNEYMYSDDDNEDDDDDEYMYSDDNKSIGSQSSDYYDDDITDSEKDEILTKNANHCITASHARDSIAPVPRTCISRFESVDDRRLLTPVQLTPVMDKIVLDMADLLGLPCVAAAALLREYKWSTEKLQDAYLGDHEKTQKKCGIIARCSNKFIQSDTSLCSICIESDKPMYNMPCGHSFCRGCWGKFLDVAVKDGPNCLYKCCPHPKCNEKVTEIEIKELAPHLLEKYRHFQLRSYVELNPYCRWCPGPDCENIATSNTGWGVFSCTCGTSFCLRCGQPPHAPASCDALSRWNEKCQNESETANWILANTKPCPKCSSRIEKNQGCNHMSCQQCKHEFCWICSRPWSEHSANTGGYYRCNRYNPETDDNDQSDRAKAQRELHRYLHYYKRFHAHSEAEKFAKKQLLQTEQRMVLLQESTENSTWIDVQFLRTAVEQLIECRRVLKYTYTYAYYLRDDLGTRERFEYHQEMLEKFTENLSEMSERSLADMKREEVVNVTRVVNRFMKKILQYVEDGMLED